MTRNSDESAKLTAGFRTAIGPDLQAEKNCINYTSEHNLILLYYIDKSVISVGLQASSIIELSQNLLNF